MVVDPVFPDVATLLTRVLVVSRTHLANTESGNNKYAVTQAATTSPTIVRITLR